MYADECYSYLRGFMLSRFSAQASRVHHHYFCGARALARKLNC